MFDFFKLNSNREHFEIQDGSIVIKKKRKISENYFAGIFSQLKYVKLVLKIFIFTICERILNTKKCFKQTFTLAKAFSNK